MSGSPRCLVYPATLRISFPARTDYSKVRLSRGKLGELTADVVPVGIYAQV